MHRNTPILSKVVFFFSAAMGKNEKKSVLEMGSSATKRARSATHDLFGDGSAGGSAVPASRQKTSDKMRQDLKKRDNFRRDRLLALGAGGKSVQAERVRVAEQLGLQSRVPKRSGRGGEALLAMQKKNLREEQAKRNKALQTRVEADATVVVDLLAEEFDDAAPASTAEDDERLVDEVSDVEMVEDVVVKKPVAKARVTVPRAAPRKNMAGMKSRPVSRISEMAMRTPPRASSGVAKRGVEKSGASGRGGFKMSREKLADITGMLKNEASASGAIGATSFYGTGGDEEKAGSRRHIQFRREERQAGRDLTISPSATPSRSIGTRNSRLKRKRGNLDNIRLKELGDGEKAKFKSLTQGIAKGEVIAKVASANIVLCGRDIVRLRGRRWLNDEVVNAFSALINERSRAHFAAEDENDSVAGNDDDDDDEDECTVVETGAVRLRRPRAYMFNSFFHTRVTSGGYDYGGVRRWPKRAGVDIAALDLVLVPVNLNNYHWVLAAVDLRHMEFLYLDSMYGGDSLGVLKTLKRWLRDEVENNHGEARAQAMKIDEWTEVICPSYLPRQEDDGSCGVFTLFMADYLELGKMPDFSQSDIGVMRQRTVLFLKDGKLPVK